MSRPTIVALTGFARSGKDTVGQILVDHHGFRRVAFGDLLKQIAEDVDPVIEYGAPAMEQEDALACRSHVSRLLDIAGGWENLKDDVPEARQFLVDLGNSLRKRIPGIEVSSVLSGLKPGERVVNTNVYHPEEIEEIRGMGGYVFRVVRPGGKPANADEARTATAEVDGTIDNSGSLRALEIEVACRFGYSGIIT